MSDKPISLTQPPDGYSDWLGELKAQIHEAQQRAAQAINLELILLYWKIGNAILIRQNKQGWGAKVVDRLAHDLRSSFPDMQGFSVRNLKYMRAFAQCWSDIQFVQQLLHKLPWGHNLKPRNSAITWCVWMKAATTVWKASILTTLVFMQGWTTASRRRF